jgi:peptide/nickel transport system permease protein
MENVVMFYEGWDRVVDIAHHLVLPVITLSLFYMALYARLMRATMLEQRGLDYVTTARAKGLTERQLTFRHVLRNALLPVVTVAGVQVGALLGSVSSRSRRCFPATSTFCSVFSSCPPASWWR